MAPKAKHVNAQDLLEQLANNDLRFEIMLSSLIELLKSKLVIPTVGELGSQLMLPLFTDEEFQAQLDKTQRKMVQEMSLARPESTIVKPDTFH